jgi:hypothetical protein
VRLGAQNVDDYAVRLVELLERYGVVPSKPEAEADIEILEADDGALSFELIGGLPDGRQPPLATVEVREEFRPDEGGYRRVRYEFELIDHERDFRRGFHMHSVEWFERRYLVVVHEHCELPIGEVSCAHYRGWPIKDGYHGVRMLIETWLANPPDCQSLECLD